LVALGASYVNVVEVRLVLTATEMLPKGSSFWKYVICGDIVRDFLERVH